MTPRTAKDRAPVRKVRSREPAGRTTAHRAPSAPRWQRRSEARPGEIVAAAVALFAERGFGATRMGDVAARAGVTKATVYLYFEDKAALFDAVVREKLTPNIDRAEALLGAYDGSTPALLRMIASLLCDVIESDAIAIPKLIMAEASAFPELARLYAERVVSRGFALVTSVVERGIARGEFRAVDPAATVPSFFAPFALLAMWRFTLAKHTDVMPPPRRVIEAHVELILRGLART